jgi:hypothetical protein
MGTSLRKPAMFTSEQYDKLSELSMEIWNYAEGLESELLLDMATDLVNLIGEIRPEGSPYYVV